MAGYLKIQHVTSLGKLTNNDFLQCMIQVLSVFASLGIRSVVWDDNLKAMKSRLKEFEIAFLHPSVEELTPELYALDCKRNRAIRGLRGTIEYQQFREEAHAVKAARLLKNAFRQHGEKPEKLSFRQKTVSIDALMKDIQQMPALQSAAETLGLKDWFLFLQTINHEFGRKYDKLAETRTSSPGLTEKKNAILNSFTTLITYTESGEGMRIAHEDRGAIIQTLNALLEKMVADKPRKNDNRSMERMVEVNKRIMAGTSAPC